ncbi:fluoride efflux transporter CrcB [Raoultibacter timonensis]|uniref:fluoride efflux transporter CrcB n=1 Tax=Raoultibacter timonensis TaxID=1907662 RepID=UPI000C83233F|nr:fluoride efflux transporter CrcB [Raoultibacter timonensis]
MLFSFLAVAAGGAIGAAGRYGVALATQALIPSEHALAGFPVATIFVNIVNIVGCFVIGFASHFFMQADFPTSGSWKLFCITGILGGFTTFSTFSLESIDLLQSGATGLGALYIGLSLALCLVGVFAGRLLAQIIWKA